MWRWRQDFKVGEFLPRFKLRWHLSEGQELRTIEAGITPAGASTLTTSLLQISWSPHGSFKRTFSHPLEPRRFEPPNACSKRTLKAIQGRLRSHAGMDNGTDLLPACYDS
jgi:hypothetical protein